jgi:hypothetical protein
MKRPLDKDLEQEWNNLSGDDVCQVAFLILL